MTAYGFWWIFMTARLLSGLADSNPIADLFDPNKPIELEPYPNTRAPDHRSTCHQSIISFWHWLYTSSIIITEDVIFESDDDDDINRAIAAIVAHQDDTDASDDNDN